MFLSELHNMIKYNYEHNLYPRSYNYKNNEFHTTVSDFDMGRQNAEYDYKFKSKFKFYPKFLFRLADSIFGKRMYEIINYINGYNYEKHILLQKINKKD